jgi:hypothetical protein
MMWDGAPKHFGLRINQGGAKTSSSSSRDLAQRQANNGL